MNIRKKAGVIIGLTVTILVVLLYGISRHIIIGGLKKIEHGLMDGFAHVESDDARNNVSRVVDAYQAQLSNLVIKAADWAQWDDTYRFVVDRNSAYQKSNLSPTTLLSLHINFIAFLDCKNKLVFSQVVDGDSVYRADAALLAQRYNLITTLRTSQKPVSGIVLFEKRPMVIAALPIVQSDGAGPSRGVFMFGRFVDNEFVAGLAAVTHLELSWSTVAEKLPMNKQITPCNDTACIHLMTDSLIAGRAVLSDVGGTPSVYLQINMPRPISRHARETLDAVQHRGRLTLLYLVVSIIVVGLTLCGVIFFILEVSVLRRLGLLARKSIDIGSEGAHRQRLPVEGNDEITTLAQSINSMLDALQKSRDAIEERDREKRVLMNTIPVGFCSLDEHLVVNPQYSKTLGTMFGVTECAGRHILNLLSMSSGSDELGGELTSYLDLVMRRVVSDRELAELNPLKEHHFTDRSIDAWYAIGFYPIGDGEDTTAKGVLMTVTDISEEKLLGIENEVMQRENIQLRQIAENPDFFREFIRETKHIIATVNDIAASLPGNTKKVASVNALFRGIHTIKGVAGSFGLNKLETITAELEDLLARMQDQPVISPQGIEEVMGLLQILTDSFGEVEALSISLFGGLLDEDGGMVHIPVAAVNRVIGELQAIRNHMSVQTIQADLLCDEACLRLEEFKRVPAGAALSRSLRLVPRLCERLGKECRVSLKGADVPIDIELAQTLNQLLVHLLRNAVDHGIEHADVRESRGKSREGEICIVVEKSRDTLTLAISDDGSGVDATAIANVACTSGVATPEVVGAMSREALYNLIFLPGFSTTGTITEVSGRGVGLDMVADTVKNRLNGTVTVTSEFEKGATFTITIPG